MRSNSDRKPPVFRRKLPCPVCGKSVRVLGDDFAHIKSWLIWHDFGVVKCPGSGVPVEGKGAVKEVS